MRLGIGGGGFLRGGFSVGRGGPRVFGGVGPIHASFGGRSRRSRGGSDSEGEFAGYAMMAILALLAVVAIVFVAAAAVSRILIPVLSLVVAMTITGIVGWLIDTKLFRRFRVIATPIFLFGSLFYLGRLINWISTDAETRAIEAKLNAKPSEDPNWLLERIAWDGVSDGSEFGVWVVVAFSAVMGVLWILYLIRGERVGAWFDSLADRIENG